MRHEDRTIVVSWRALVHWWHSFAAEARARAIQSLEQKPMVACPGPPLGVARFALLATLFQPPATLPSSGAGQSSSGFEV